MLLKTSKGEKGFVLITTYFLVASLLTALAGYCIRSVNDLHLAQRRLDRLQALYTAESVAESALSWFRRQTAIPPPSSPPLPTGADSGRGETYNSILVDRDDDDPSVFWITAAGTFRGITRTVQVSVRMETFASYAYAQDTADPTAYFVSGTTVTGPFHTNDVVQTYGAPTFNGTVSSSASAVYNHDGGYSADGDTAPPGFVPVWNGGDPLLNQPRKPFPPSTAVSALGLSQGYLNVWSRGWVRFNSNGTLNWSSVGPISQANPGSNLNYAAQSSWLKGLKFLPTANPPAGEAGAYVEGTVAASFAIASNKDVGVSGAVTYSCQYDQGGQFVMNGCGSSGGPTLGVMSEKNVVIMNSAWPASGSALQISGAFAALGGGLKAQYPSGTGARTFNLFGSLMEKTSQKKGILNDTDPNVVQMLEGYQGNYYHDDRLTSPSTSPSGFPMAVSVLSWEPCDTACVAEH